jgi:hypothetical protein
MAEFIWHCKDLQHPLIYAENLKIPGLTGGRTFLPKSKMVSLYIKIKMASTPSQNEYLLFEPISARVSFRLTNLKL